MYTMYTKTKTNVFHLCISPVFDTNYKHFGCVFAEHQCRRHGLNHWRDMNYFNAAFMCFLELQSCAHHLFALAFRAEIYLLLFFIFFVKKIFVFCRKKSYIPGAAWGRVNDERITGLHYNCKNCEKPFKCLCKHILQKWF